MAKSKRKADKSGVAPLFDGLADGSAVAAPIRAGSARLRVARTLDDGRDGFGPEPAEPAILTLGEAQAARIDCAEPGGSGACRVAGVTLREREYPAEGKNPCRLRCSCQCVVELEDHGEWVVAEQRAETPEAAREGMDRVRAALDGTGDGEDGREPTPLPERPRFQLRGEGPRVVLRDFRGETPRDGAGGYALTTFFLGLLTLGAAGATAWLYSAERRGFALGLAVAAILFAIATYAFSEIARFARAYSAGSLPVLSLGQGRVIVAPWPSRAGAVALEPEGRFGAAIPLAEVEDLKVEDAEVGVALRLHTLHGPFDVFVTDDRGEAELWRAAVARLLERMRKPGGGPSVKKLVRALA